MWFYKQLNNKGFIYFFGLHETWNSVWRMSLVCLTRAMPNLLMVNTSIVLYIKAVQIENQGIHLI